MSIFELSPVVGAGVGAFSIIICASEKSTVPVDLTRAYLIGTCRKLCYAGSVRPVRITRKLVFMH